MILANNSNGKECVKIAEEKEHRVRVMVLNDGTTFTDIGGCTIVDIDDQVDVDDIEDVLKSIDPSSDASSDGLAQVRYRFGLSDLDTKTWRAQR